MKSKRLHWLAPLLAVWVAVWQACFGALALCAVPAPKASCCSAHFQKAQSMGCPASCCPAPAVKDAERVPAEPGATTTSIVPDWVPALIADFLLPRGTAVTTVSVALADPSLDTASAPLFRRYCALLI